MNVLAIIMYKVWLEPKYEQLFWVHTSLEFFLRHWRWCKFIPMQIVYSEIIFYCFCVYVIKNITGFNPYRTNVENRVSS